MFFTSASVGTGQYGKTILTDFQAFWSAGFHTGFARSAEHGINNRKPFEMRHEKDRIKYPDLTEAVEI